MFARQLEEEYVNNIGGADQVDPDRGRWWPLLVILAMVGGFLAWAYYYEIEEVTRGQGRVIPSSQIQSVQTLEGGIVRQILVSEGDLVEQDQLLMQIDDTSFMSQQGELEKQKAAFQSELTRLEAEANLRDEIVFDPAFQKEYPRETSAQAQVFYSRRAQLESELRVLDNSLQQRQAELVELRALIEKTEGMIAPLSEERELTEALVASKAVPRIELLRLNSRLAELEGDLAVSRATQIKLTAAVEEVRSKIEAAKSGYILTARQRLAQIQSELAIVEETLRAADDRVQRTQVRAPTRGTVNRLSVTTLGAVVQPGAILAEIVPADDGLLIEANVLPSDVAFIKPGDHVAVKITAYDYLVYGSLPGVVERIGADTIRDEDGAEFFEIIVRTEMNFLGTEDDPLPISPGMVASLDIQTGRKSVLDYLMKPIRRAQAEALRER